MLISKNNAGFNAEKLAANFLVNHGLTFVSRNYHCRFGEIDLIMQDTNTLVFIEVRMRSSNQFGGAGASITKQKQTKLIATAEHYLQKHGQTACRFDVILMHNKNLDNIEWIRNAFDA